MGRFYFENCWRRKNCWSLRHWFGFYYRPAGYGWGIKAFNFSVEWRDS